MSDRESVIKGLVCCIESYDTCECPDECEYRSKYNECEQGLMKEALALLKDTERLAQATKQAEGWMSKAPYLCYDLAKELIEAAKEVVK